MTEGTTDDACTSCVPRCRRGCASRPKSVSVLAPGTGAATAPLPLSPSAGRSAAAFRRAASLGGQGEITPARFSIGVGIGIGIGIATARSYSWHASQSILLARCYPTKLSCTHFCPSTCSFPLPPLPRHSTFKFPFLVIRQVMEEIQVRFCFNFLHRGQELCCWLPAVDRLWHDVGQHLGLTLGIFPDDDAKALGCTGG